MKVRVTVPSGLILTVFLVTVAVEIGRTRAQQVVGCFMVPISLQHYCRP
jgi:hypothetical protein